MLNGELVPRWGVDYLDGGGKGPILRHVDVGGRGYSSIGYPRDYRCQIERPSPELEPGSKNCETFAGDRGMSLRPGMVTNGRSRHEIRAQME